MDDAVIFSSNWQDHLNNLNQTLIRIGEAGLTIKQAKFSYVMFKYLGHVLGRGQVRPEQATIIAVKEFATPKKRKDVWVFMGLAGYCWHFIPDFATFATHH